MNKATEINRLLDQCTEQELKVALEYLKARLPQHPLEKEWGVNSDVILSAICRSSDLTKRGVRGIIAEAVFEQHVLAQLKGWASTSFVGDRAYDFLLRSEQIEKKEIRIQVKLQRMRKQQPMLASEGNRNYPKDMFVVEVQKTRGGIDARTNEDTRPYRFGEFDILAVNMHPSTGVWHKFFFTVANWLLPRTPSPALIEIFQPVAQAPNDVWTSEIQTCIGWLEKGEQKRILDIKPEFLQRRPKKVI